MDEKIVVQGELKVIDIENEINIPDIENEFNMYEKLLKESGFTLIKDVLHEELYSVISLRADAFSEAITFRIGDKSYCEEVYYDFRLEINRSDVGDENNAKLLLLDLMDLVIEGQSFNLNDTYKKIMSGERVNQRDLYIDEY